MIKALTITLGLVFTLNTWANHYTNISCDDGKDLNVRYVTKGLSTRSDNYRERTFIILDIGDGNKLYDFNPSISYPGGITVISFRFENGVIGLLEYVANICDNNTDYPGLLFLWNANPSKYFELKCKCYGY